MRVEALPPRPECPDPSRWSAPDDWSSETEVSVFMGELVMLLKPDFVVETGSHMGFTAEQIGWALVELERGTGVSLEIKPEWAATARKQIGAAKMTVLEQSSLTYHPDQPIDLLFVDSDFSTRMPEVRHFHRWASPRCVVVAHDPAVPSDYPGVKGFLHDMQAVVDEGVVYPWFYLPTPRGLAMTRYR